MAIAEKPNIKIKYDGALTIATGHSRKETNWRTRETTWSEFLLKISQTMTTHETLPEYMRMAKPKQDEIKDVGGFVGGALKSGRRKADNVAWRSLITLDVDFGTLAMWDSLETLYEYAAAMYTTHKHTKAKPRFRIVIPVSRSVTPEEYQAISRRVAADLGINLFDDTTYEPHRLMYWPSTSTGAEFIFRYTDGPWLDADEVLARYKNWQDPLEWPHSERMDERRQRLKDKAGDPLTKTGLIGAFNRTYTIREAIDEYLSDVYEPTADGRYTYKAGSTAGGLVLYDNDTFAFSHHGTDPVGGLLVNAFDLVRLHKFGAQDDDEDPQTPVKDLPSYKAMQELARNDDAVKDRNLKERLEGITFDYEPGDENWASCLEIDRTGKVRSTIDNCLVILKNDPNLKGRVGYNEFSGRLSIRSDLFWRKKSESDVWIDSDDAELQHYLEKVYGIDRPTRIATAFMAATKRNGFHPVREYLNGLLWDGKKRVESLFIEYLGAENTEYVRTVTRKSLAAAVARIFHPGIKFDYVTVLVGPQGIGKTHILRKLGKEWFSDSLVTVQGKEAFEQLQGRWILEMGEMSATKRAEVEAIKLFISKEEDVFRVAYGRHTEVFKRQCVFFGTTNDGEFLTDKTGNRRFWPVRCAAQPRKKSVFNDLSPDEIDQVWAEAVEIYEAGEQLYLTEEMDKIAREMQELHTEESPKTGMIREFLEMPLPEDWKDMDLWQRREYVVSGGDAMAINERDRVCIQEIWCECLGGDLKQLNWAVSKEIGDILRSMKGWRPYDKAGGRLKFGSLYGQQRAFVRR